MTTMNEWGKVRDAEGLAAKERVCSQARNEYQHSPSIVNALAMLEAERAVAVFRLFLTNNPR
jgi:hypothetical protein